MKQWRRPEELATAHGVTMEAVQSAAKTAAVAQLNQAVADRLIEQINNSLFSRWRPRPAAPPPGNNNNQGQGATTQGVNGATSAVFLPFAKW